MINFVYLSKEDIIESNFEVVREFGGNYLPPYNLLNESALDYLVEIIEHGIIFGEVMYPTIESKAALYERMDKTEYYRNIKVRKIISTTLFILISSRPKDETNF